MSFRFREWPVYKDARALRNDIKKRVLPRIEKREQFTLGDQLLRAVLSIVLNIAEGAYRKSDKDFARFLNQALTSLYEVVACLDAALDDTFIVEKEHQEFLDRAEAIARQLSAFSGTLKPTGVVSKRVNS